MDSCILGCNDGFLGFWSLLQQFRRVTVLYFVPGNTEKRLHSSHRAPTETKIMRWNNFLEFGPNVVFIASSLHWEQLHNPNRKVMPMAVYLSFAVRLGNCMVFYILYGKKFGGRISVTYWFYVWSGISCSPKTLLALGVSNIQKNLKCNVHINKGKLGSFFPSFLFTLDYVEM